jgi:hypothetical protein
MFYLILNDRIINQHQSDRVLRNYANQQRLHGAIIVDESQLNQQEQAYDQCKDISSNSIIKIHYQPRESNMTVPVQRYEEQRAPYIKTGKIFRPQSVKRRKK